MRCCAGSTQGLCGFVRHGNHLCCLPLRPRNLFLLEIPKEFAEKQQKASARKSKGTKKFEAVRGLPRIMMAGKWQISSCMEDDRRTCSRSQAGAWERDGRSPRPGATPLNEEFLMSTDMVRKIAGERSRHSVVELNDVCHVFV